MTREGQFIEADGRVCVGGEWLDLHLANVARIHENLVDTLDRIDDTLMTYDSQHADGDQPWPYGSF